uniref:Putative methyltransferase n=1 Tax=viral metagenome TaxID=1070528 RepID=A0A6M3IPM8_9ZZZZ
MKKIVIAYHVYMYGNRYMEMIIDQLRKINNAVVLKDGTMEKNLIPICHKLYIGIVDTPDKKPDYGVEWLSGWFENHSSKIINATADSKVEVVLYPDNLELRRTLWWIRDYAKENPDDYILFFHTKGITHFTKATEDWRKYMEYFVIERWKDCVAKLDEGYDACGVLWNKYTPVGYFPHFSGSFYWAKASYINTLDHYYIDSAWRYHMEFWIGNNPNGKIYEFHNSRLNDKDSLIAGKGHYDVEYPRIKYVENGNNTCDLHGI